MHLTFLHFILSPYLPYYLLGITFEEYVLGPLSRPNPKPRQYGFVFYFIVGGEELKLYFILEDFSFWSVNDDPNYSFFLN